jgi:hypothetical protein
MIVAMLALFVALTGTAVATTSALITGNQIKNSSITGADIKNKSLKPIDFRGSVRGPRGLAGPAGTPGAAGTKGDKGDKGDQGIQGPAGPFPDGDMPAGKTVRGYWAIAGVSGSFPMDNISYIYRMSVPLTPHVIPEGAAPPAGCSGDADNPIAAAGHLCIFEKEKSGAMSDPTVFFNTRSGVGIFATTASSGYVDGTWAATSPAAAAAASAPSVRAYCAGSGPGC